jgi:DNA-binding beta-propeller fold protein YncE
MKKGIVALLLILSITGTHAQFTLSSDSSFASEAFRLGVESYGRGRYAESLASFEKALSSSPSDSLTLYWLGKSYFRLGLTNMTFEFWNRVMASSGISPFIQSKLELAGELADPVGLPARDRFIRMAGIEGQKDKVKLFSRPSWIEPLPDGSILLVSHGTNTVLVLDANARILRSYNAGTVGFDRPFACTVLDDGTIFVSEFQADRIARMDPNGSILGYSGDATGPGRLSGPQYLCADEDDFVYVVDVGFSRIVKYSRDGKMVLSFGKRSPEFEGLRMPTGIAAFGGKVYVVDAVLDSIIVFDSYGNHIGRIPASGFIKPEGMRVLSDGSLLLADGSRVLVIDPETGDVKELYRSERRKARMISAAFDANGELLVADFDASELSYLSDPTSRYAGLSVDVRTVNSDSYPKIFFDVSVRDRFGTPITGLASSNFYVSESVSRKEQRVEGEKPVEFIQRAIIPALNYSFEGSLDLDKRLDVAFLIEGSTWVKSRRTEARDIISTLSGFLGSDFSSRVVIAGKTAQPPSGTTMKSMGDTVLAMEASDEWKFDSGLRLAAGALFGASGRKTIIHIGTGSVNEAFLKGTALAELASLLVNNDIIFSCVIVGKGGVAETLSYLAGRTGGSIYRADRAEGLQTIIDNVRSTRTGLYRISYLASADPGFGRSYLPFNVEVYLRDRSGRDETGYFAPLR